jgi:tetratricopeptide (TPR) repeat protein
VYFSKGNFDKAIADYTEAIRLAPNFVVYSTRGLAYQSKGDLDHAIADFESALRINPNDDVARKNLEILRQKQGW